MLRLSSTTTALLLLVVTVIIHQHWQQQHFLLGASVHVKHSNSGRLDAADNRTTTTTATTASSSSSPRVRACQCPSAADSHLQAGAVARDLREVC